MNGRGRGRAARWIGMALLGVLGACDAGTGPEAPDVTLTVTAGAEGVGLEGELLPGWVRVRAVDGAGRRLPGVRVSTRVVSGGGEVLHAGQVTDASGLVSLRWRLGGAGPQSLVLATPDGAEVEVRATALPLAEADVIVVRGSTAPLRGVLLTHTEGDLQIIDERVAPDTLIRLPPVGSGGAEVLVFPGRERLLHRTPVWTPRPDTVHLWLEPALPVRITLRILDGGFERVRAEAEEQLALTQAAWDAAGMGIRLDEVIWEDHTGAGEGFEVRSTGLCSGLLPGASLRVSIVTSIDGGGLGGFGCNFSGHAYLGERWVSWPYLLAHELGHTFSLPHATAGMMEPRSPSSGLRDGEVYRAHFATTSALNTIFGAQRPDEQRACPFLSYQGPCLPLDYVLGSWSSG